MIFRGQNLEDMKKTEVAHKAHYTFSLRAYEHTLHICKYTQPP